MSQIRQVLVFSHICAHKPRCKAQFNNLAQYISVVGCLSGIGKALTSNHQNHHKNKSNEMNV